MDANRRAASHGTPMHVTVRTGTKLTSCCYDRGYGVAFPTVRLPNYGADSQHAITRQMRDITGSKDVIASFLAWWKATRCGVVFVRGAANLQFAKDPFKRVALHAGAAEAGIQLSERADLVAEVPTPALHCCQLRGSFLRQGRQPGRLSLVRVALGRGGRRRCL